MNSIKGQLSIRGVIIGCIGCAVITASSVYVALKMGALPWPIIFAAILSLFLLKVVSRGKSTLNEANVTHTIMSSGAMVAGGLAFTIPGAWMLGLGDDISWVQLIVIAVCGSALGLIGSIALRRHFIEDAKLEYPIGEAAAKTLEAGDTGGNTGKKLFGAMAFGGVFALLRDALGIIPRMLCQLPISGVTFGIYCSPMMLAVGFLVGTGAVVIWFAGAVLGNFGIIVGGTALGFWDTDTATQIVSCLGMGCMMGCGVAVIVKDIIPKGCKLIKDSMRRNSEESKLLGLTAQSAKTATCMNFASGCSQAHESDVAFEVTKKPFRAAVVTIFVIACIAIAATLLLGLPPIVSVVVVACAFVACAMSAQSVGQTGIDPMEIFGLIVLLLVSLFAQVDELRLFFIAALVAVACGLAGDVMNDFKAGHVLRTSPKAQWIGQGIGAVIGSVVAVAVIQVLFVAYGADSFGVGKEFVSAQASVVATMVGGIPNITAFIIGLVAGFILYLVGIPSMMLGLGIYLPFYMSFTAFLGCMVKVIFDLSRKKKLAAMSEEERERAEAATSESGLILASGLLGGESIMGIILALIVAGGALL